MTDLLEGKKTYIGAFCVCIGAVCKVGVDWYYGNPLDVAGFVMTFSIGLGILGIGKKIHK